MVFSSSSAVMASLHQQAPSQQRLRIPACNVSWLRGALADKVAAADALFYWIATVWSGLLRSENTGLVDSFYNPPESYMILNISNGQ